MEVLVEKTVDVYERVEVVDSELTGESVGLVVTVFVMRIDGEPLEEVVDVLEIRDEEVPVPDFTIVAVLTLEREGVLETTLVLEMNAEPDRVVEPVDVFESCGDLLDVKDASKLLVFTGVPVAKAVRVIGAVKVCRRLAEGVTDGPGATEDVKDTDGVLDLFEEGVDDPLVVLERKRLGL